MERSNFFNDQHVLAEDLNNIGATGASQSILRTQAPLGDSGGIGQSSSFWTGSVPQGGIYGSPADYLNSSINFFPSVSSPSQIVVAPGTAIDVNGEMIVMTSSKTLNKGSSDSNYIWTASSNVLNYIKLAYQEVSGSVKTDDEGNSHPTRYTPSFYITVDGTVPTDSEILLGTFVGTGTGDITGTIQDRRMYVRTIVPANAVILDPTVKPISAHTSVEDHIRAVGTGTPTQTNPHGLTPADIGISNLSESVIQHRKDSHVNGIMLTQRDGTSILSGLGSVVSASASAYISFNAFVGATASINGVLVSGSIPNLPGTSAPGDGVYWVVLNASGTPLFLSTGSVSFDDEHPHRYPEYLLLGSASVADNGDDITSYADLRQFYVMVQEDIRGDIKEQAVVPTNPLNQYGDLEDNLNRIRGHQGQIVNGTGSVWPGSVTVGQSGSIKSLANQFEGIDYATSRRSLDQNYQNVYGRTIFVSVSTLHQYDSPDGSALRTELTVAPEPQSSGNPFVVNTFSTFNIGPATGSQIVTLAGSVSGFVPPGWYYLVSGVVVAGTGTFTLVKWTEYS